MNPLLDLDFIKKLQHESHNRTIWGKIIALDINENPLSQIEGRVTGGSINIDGASSVRRTCSLTLCSKNLELDINNYYWGLNTKFNVSIGLTNDIDNNYPNIIWFPMGIFICSAFNTAITTNNYTINISGKDKMCLLNGDMGGHFTHSIDFNNMKEDKYIYTDIKLTTLNYEYGKYYFYRNGNNTYYIPVNSEEEIQSRKKYGYIDNEGRIVKSIKGLDENTLDSLIVSNRIFEIDNTPTYQYELSIGPYDEEIKYYTKQLVSDIKELSIKETIYYLLTVIVGEKPHKIIINDIEDWSKEIIEYRNDEEPLYMFKNINSGQIEQITINPEEKVYLTTEDGDNGIRLDNIKIIYDSLINQIASEPTKVFRDKESNEIYTIVKIGYGDIAGFRLTKNTYPGKEFIVNVGETVTSVFDKIIKIFPDYEYFYDIDGNFIFQKKKTYMNESWTPIKEDEAGGVYVEPSVYTSAYVYSFENQDIITSFNNTPNLTNLKNDYSIWGQRQTSTGAKLPILYRYAIDDKPIVYATINFEEENCYDKNNILIPCQKSVVYTTLDELEGENIKHCDWREIIYQMSQDYYRYYDRLQQNDGYYKIANEYKNDETYYTYGTFGFEVADNNIKDILYTYHNFNEDFYEKISSANAEFELYTTGITGYERYYIDMNAFWREIYNPDIEINEIKKESVFKNEYDPNATYYKQVTSGKYEESRDAVQLNNLLPFDIENNKWCVEKPDGTIEIIKTYDTENKKYLDTKYLTPIRDLNEDEYSWIEDSKNRGKVAYLIEHKDFYDQHVWAWQDTLGQYHPIEYTWEEMVEDQKRLQSWNYSLEDVKDEEEYKLDSENSYYIKKTVGYEPYRGPWIENEIFVKKYKYDGEFYQREYTGKKIIGYEFKEDYKYHYLLSNDEGQLTTIPISKSQKYKFNFPSNLVKIKASEILTNNQYVNKNGEIITNKINGVYLNAEGSGDLITTKEELKNIQNSNENLSYLQLSYSDAKKEFENIGEEILLYVYNSASEPYYKLSEWYDYDSTTIYYYADKDDNNRMVVLNNTGRITIEDYNMYSEKYNGLYVLTSTASLAEPGEKGKKYLQINRDDICTSSVTYYKQLGSDSKQDFYVWLNYTDNSIVSTSLFLIPDEKDLGYNPDTNWHYNVTENPAALNFWFDFMETNSEMGKYSISAVGDRTKVIKDDKIGGIYFKGLPQVILTSKDEYVNLINYLDALDGGYNIVQYDSTLKPCLVTSGLSKSAQDELDNLLYAHTYCTESISINILPLYTLEPNTRVLVYDEKTKINGQYLIQRITIPLTYNGTSSITATKAIERIY